MNATQKHKPEIVEGRPLTYRAADGALIEVSVAGPIEPVYTLWVNGQAIATAADEQLIREMAREESYRHNARGATAQAGAPSPDAVEHAAKLRRMADNWDRAAANHSGDRTRTSPEVLRGYAQACRDKAAAIEAGTWIEPTS